eukprot:8156068-Pyramimonas_sp.AAC.1
MPGYWRAGNTRNGRIANSPGSKLIRLHHASSFSTGVTGDTITGIPLPKESLRCCSPCSSGCGNCGGVQEYSSNTSSSPNHSTCEALRFADTSLPRFRFTPRNTCVRVA